MPTFAGYVRQYLPPPTTQKLDTALLRLFPEIPDDARRILRGPLKRWHRGAVTFLSSQQTWVDNHTFASVWFGLAGLYAAEKQTHVATLLTGLRREIDYILPLYGDCCWPHSRALLHVLDWLFIDPVVGRG
jgi:hypothetical protein